MSYDIQLFRKETKALEQVYSGDCFFENEQNLVPFTETQIEYLKKRLEIYEYQFEENNKYGWLFVHPEYGEAFLTLSGLYFSTSFNDESIFNVGLSVSEFTDTGEFEKYDPQCGGWEEV